MIGGFEFWLFFAFVLLGFSVFYRKPKVRNYFLFLCSMLLFKQLGGWIPLAFLALSILLNWGGGFLVSPNISGKRASKFWLVIGFILNLSILFYYYYNDLITKVINSIFDTNIVYQPLFTFKIDEWSVLLPSVGLMVVSLQAISYLTDIYRRQIEPCKNPLDLGIFLSFFPQWIIGPLAQARNFLPQLKKHYQLSSKEFASALFLIICAWFKIVIFADFLGENWVYPVLSDMESGGQNYNTFDYWTALYGNVLQIYAVFSGYAELSLGIAAILGFHIPINFNSPFKAHSMSNFWERWNISLRNFIKDYIYIPLGGSQHGIIRTVLNLGLSFLLGALFYGAHIMILLWSGIQYLLVLFEKIFSLDGRPKHIISRFFKVFICFNITVFGWLIFRSESIDTLKNSLDSLFLTVSTTEIIQSCGQHTLFLSLILAGLLLHFLPCKWQNRIKSAFGRMSWFGWGFFSLAVLAIIYIITNL